MAECTIIAPAEYTGNTVCDGGTEQERLDNHCSWVSWVKDTFSVGLNTFASQLTTCVEWIATQRDNIQEDRDYVENAKTAIEAIAGADYAGEWNNTDDFTGKWATYNGSAWVALNPTIGEEPSEPNWLPIGVEKQTIVYTNVDYTAKVGELVAVDTTNNVVIVTLPATPNDGDLVDFIDIKSDTNKLTIARNGELIMGLDEDMEVEKKNISFTLQFFNNDWRVR